MINISYRFILAFLAAIFAWPVSATPPDIIDVRDDLFGVTEDSIWLLRSTHDNLGVYDADHRDIVLIAIDRRTGEERLWPVYRARSRLQEGAGGDPSVGTEGEMLPGSVNPFEMLRDRDGLVPSASEWRTGGSATVEGDSISVAYEDGVAFHIKAASLLRDMASSLERLADRVGEYDRLAPVSVKDLLIGHATGMEICNMLEPVFHSSPASSDPIRLLRVTCTDDGQTASLVIPIARLRQVP